MTPEDVATFKEEVLGVVETAFAKEGATKKDIIAEITKGVEVLEGEPEMGGMGTEADNGMPMPAEEDGEGE